MWLRIGGNYQSNRGGCLLLGLHCYSTLAAFRFIIDTNQLADHLVLLPFNEENKAYLCSTLVFQFTNPLICNIIALMVLKMVWSNLWTVDWI